MQLSKFNKLNHCRLYNDDCLNYHVATYLLRSGRDTHTDTQNDYYTRFCACMAMGNNISFQWQQEQVKKFCRKYQLASKRERVVRDYHFLFNEERKIVFCFVPKVIASFINMHII